MYIRIMDSLYGFVIFKYIESLNEFEIFLKDSISLYLKKTKEQQLNFNNFVARGISEELVGMEVKAQSDFVSIRNRVVRKANELGVNGREESLSLDVGVECYLFAEFESLVIQDVKANKIDYRALLDRAFKKLGIEFTDHDC